MSHLYNEYDENPVRRTLKQRKKKKLKRKVRVCLSLFGIMAIIGFLLSDIPKIKSIHIQGLSHMSEESLREHLSIHQSSYYLWMNKEKVEKEIQELPIVKNVTVHCDWIGNVYIDIEESPFLAYAKMNDKIYAMNDIGEVIEVKEKKDIQELKTLPLVQGFQNYQLLKQFAQEFKEVPSFVQSEMNEIVLSPGIADPTRLKCFMKDNNMIYVRVEELAKNLDTDVFNYQAYKSQRDGNFEYLLEGNFLRIKPV